MPSYGTESSMISTVGHEHHRFRRGLLDKFFSKKSVQELAPVVQETLVKLMRRFEEAHEYGTVLCLDDAFTGLTADIISYYSYGESLDFLEDKNFKSDFRGAAYGLVSFLHINRFFPLLIPTLQRLPRWFTCKLRPELTALFDIQSTIQQHSIQSMHESGFNKSSKITRRLVIFDALNDPTIPGKERTQKRLQDEGTIVLVAGTEVVARALTIAVFHLNWNKSLLLKLRRELQQVMPTPTSLATWSQLEQLPYLVCCHCLWLKQCIDN